MSIVSNFVKNGKKIIGVGANFRTAPNFVKAPEEPIIFMKPTTAYITNGQFVYIPKGFQVNQEVELGVIIGQICKNVTEEEAMSKIGGYCVIQDLTSTDRMEQARKTGLSWLIGKGFDTACPVSECIPKDKIPDPHNVELWCTVNGVERQRGNTKDFVFTIPQIISFISQYITLEPNDLILTGSPPNMGPIHPGDVVKSGITGLNTELCFVVSK